jgi:eukaryotic-like serine/threonine-protein kinase
MSGDQTQYQSGDDLRRARHLSMTRSHPPAEVPGYTVQRLLGSGAYGEVWSGIDRNTGRRVAIKFYTRRSNVDFSLLSREVEKLVYLAADRYVVQLLDVGWDAKPPYYVMDYIENGSLEDELTRRGKLPTDEAVEMIQEIAVGLKHLHNKGILHCDLKPGNVLLDEDSKPRLADFGQSRLSSEQDAALGTLFFMAPEQADLKAAPDARWDVYALGALLYCMIVGEPPYRDPKTLDKVESEHSLESRLANYRRYIKESPRPTLHRKQRGVDKELAALIDRCIAPDPRKRFSSIQDVLSALQRRAETNAMRPLLVLGVLGPLLLLGVMLFFAWNAYSNAVNQSDDAIVQKAVDSNHWAAHLAARSASEQINSYFQAVSQLAEDPDFRALFVKTINDETFKECIAKLSDPQFNEPTGPNKDEIIQWRRKFLDLEVRKKLHEPLEQRMTGAEYPRAASWLVYDRTGTQIASTFAADDAVNTIGKNFSFRSYFTGKDYDSITRKANGEIEYQIHSDPYQREHLDKPHMSAVFKSRATGTWKFAFSVPIFIGEEFQGVAACTVDTGNFTDFENRPSQYAMLIDLRNGPDQGIVLEHPLIDNFFTQQAKLPKAKQSELPDRISQTKFDHRPLSDGHGIIEDPFVEDRLGEPYKGEWIAASAEVHRREYSKDLDKKRNAVETGLVVIAMENKERVVAPAHRLGSELLRTGTIALATIVAVACGLWLFVVRVRKKSHDALSRSFSPTSESPVSSQNVRTVPATPNQRDSTEL